MKDSIIMDIRKIRATLESFDKSDFHYKTSFYNCLDGFPSGCCGDTSNLLGLFLKNAYGKDSMYISGKGLGNNREKSHAWLLCDGYIIDITADQFNSIGYNLDNVIVSTSSDFHESFSRIDRHEINYDRLCKTPISGVLHKANERIRNLTPAIFPKHS